MAYVIKRSDQSIFTIINDKAIDRETIALALVGRGAVNYGTDFAQNFVQLFENFASTRPPLNPMAGTLWYCTGPGAPKIKVYSGTAWVTVDGDATPQPTPNTTMSRDANGATYATAYYGAMKGNADTATTLQTARRITVAGDATGNVAFDGSANVTLNLSIASAATTDKLAVGRKITLTGPVRGETVFDGTKDVTIATSFQGGTSFDIDIAGNATTATRWAAPMTLTLNGDVSGTASFDGSRATTMAVTLKKSPVAAGTYNRVEINDKGIVVAGSVYNRIEFANRADDADRADRADLADRAITADSATRATTATTATRAASADTATYATKAGQWDSAIRLTLGGSLTGNTSFDGSANVTLNGGLASTGVVPGIYNPAAIRQFEVTADGRIKGIANGTIDTGDGGTATRATTADKWTTARTLTLSGDITGSASIDGSANVNLVTNLANSGVTPGVYRNIDIRNIEYLPDGRVKAFTQYAANAARLNVSDLPGLTAGYNVVYSPVANRMITTSGPVGSTPNWQTSVTMPQWNCSPDGYRIVYVSAGSGTPLTNIFIKFQVFAGTTLLYEQGGSGSGYNSHGIDFNPDVNPLYETDNTLTGYTKKDFTVKVALFGGSGEYEVVTRIFMTEIVK